MIERPRRRRRAYYQAADYPWLLDVQQQWQIIAREAKTALESIAHQLGYPPSQSWILPLVPEPEDRGVFADEICAAARSLAPTTTELVGAQPLIVGYSFSKLVSGKYIAPHYHSTPYLNAILCLDDGGGGSYLLVDGKRHDYRTGGLVVFDYTLDHEARNDGPADRIALIMIFDPKRRGS